MKRIRIVRTGNGMHPWTVDISGELQQSFARVSEAKAYCRDRWNVTAWQRDSYLDGRRSVQRHRPLDGNCAAWN